MWSSWKAPLKELLARMPRAHTVLEVGSGTGHFTHWLKEQGLLAVGLDRSLPMLVEATRLDGPPWVRCSGSAFLQQRP